MRTTTIRITEDTHQTLRNLAKATRLPIHQVVAKALEQYEERRFWDEVDEAYARIWADPKAAAEERAERALWETTLADGLEDFPYNHDEEESE